MLGVGSGIWQATCRLAAVEVGQQQHTGDSCMCEGSTAILDQAEVNQILAKKPIKYG